MLAYPVPLRAEGKIALHHIHFHYLSHLYRSTKLKIRVIFFSDRNSLINILGFEDEITSYHFFALSIWAVYNRFAGRAADEFTSGNEGLATYILIAFLKFFNPGNPFTHMCLHRFSTWKCLLIASTVKN